MIDKQAFLDGYMAKSAKKDYVDRVVGRVKRQVANPLGDNLKNQLTEDEHAELMDLFKELSKG